MPPTKSKSKSKSKTNCKKGTIYRKSYVRHTKTKNVKVPGNCIKATSQSGKKTSIITRRVLKSKSRSQSRAKKQTKSKSKSCSKGQIKRAAYERKYSKPEYTKADGTKVKTSTAKRVVAEGCTLARGKPGHGKQMFALEKDVLKPYGYEDVKNKSDLQRHRSLKRALRDGVKPLPLMRRVNALYVLNKNQDPNLASVFKADRDYIKTTDEYKRRETARPKSKSKSKTK